MSGLLDNPVTVPAALPVLTEELEASGGMAQGGAVGSAAAPAPAVASIATSACASVAAPVAVPAPVAAAVPLPESEPLPAAALAPEPAAAKGATPPPLSPPLDARVIEDEVLAELAQRIDLMFEYRLREALAPTLARAADLLIREAREEVALTLRDVVSRAVAQQIARRRAGR